MYKLQVGLREYNKLCIKNISRNNFSFLLSSTDASRNVKKQFHVSCLNN